MIKKSLLAIVTILLLCSCEGFSYEPSNYQPETKYLWSILIYAENGTLIKEYKTTLTMREYQNTRWHKFYDHGKLVYIPQAESVVVIWEQGREMEEDNAL